MSISGKRYWGIKIIAAWTGLLGIASLVLAFPQTNLYLPLGVLYLIGAYGLWFRYVWGAFVVPVAWIFGVVVREQPLALVGVAVISAYLYYQIDNLK